jgi:plasmid maintenance system antidote protein VapI
MSINEKYRVLLKQRHRTPAYWSQIARRDFTEDLLRWMETRGLNQARLAEALNVSSQFITKVLRTNANLTIETMTKLALALGCQVRIHLADRNSVTEWRDRPSDITRVTMSLGGNVTLLSSTRFQTTVRGSPTSAALPSVVNG